MNKKLIIIGIFTILSILWMIRGIGEWLLVFAVNISEMDCSIHTLACILNQPQLYASTSAGLLGILTAYIVMPFIPLIICYYFYHRIKNEPKV